MVLNCHQLILLQLLVRRRDQTTIKNYFGEMNNSENFFSMFCTHYLLFLPQVHIVQACTSQTSLAWVAYYHFSARPKSRNIHQKCDKSLQEIPRLCGSFFFLKMDPPPLTKLFDLWLNSFYPYYSPLRVSILRLRHFVTLPQGQKVKSFAVNLPT